MNIAIVGLGLIGGSLSRAFKKYTNFCIYAFDINSSVLNKAYDDNNIDFIIKNKVDFQKADIIFISLYPDDTISFVEENIEFFKKGAIICDLCGIKAKVNSRLNKLCKNDFNYISLHPMAGREFSGYDNSTADLFCGSSWICTTNNLSSIMHDILNKIGIGKIVSTTPEKHDEIIAYTSELPHILASSYVSMPNFINHNGYSGGSFEDVSRVGFMNGIMWSEIFISNKKYLSEQIDILINNLKSFKNAIDSENKAGLLEIINKSNKIKNEDKKYE